jgi:hypothetical protein
MTEAIRIHNTGGPEVMSWEAVALAAAGPGEALVRHRYVGVNFIDIYHRRGVYKPPLPRGLDSEAAGVVVEEPRVPSAPAAADATLVVTADHADAGLVRAEPALGVEGIFGVRRRCHSSRVIGFGLRGGRSRRACGRRSPGPARADRAANPALPVRAQKTHARAVRAEPPSAGVEGRAVVLFRRHDARAVD